MTDVSSLSLQTYNEGGERLEGLDLYISSIYQMSCSVFLLENYHLENCQTERILAMRQIILFSAEILNI